MTASQHMVQANGLRFRTMVDGPPQADMFILLHGFPDGAELWSRQVDALAKAGCLAVAPDLRGYGLSDAHDTTENYSIDHLVDDVAALVITGDADGMVAHREHREVRPLGAARIANAGHPIGAVGLLAVGSPVPLVRPGVRVKNDHAVVEVSVRHK